MLEKPDLTEMWVSKRKPRIKFTNHLSKRQSFKRNQNENESYTQNQKEAVGISKFRNEERQCEEFDTQMTY